MKKVMLLLGMATGSFATYMLLNEDMQKGAKKAMKSMKNDATKLVDKAMN